MDNQTIDEKRKSVRGCVNVKVSYRKVESFLSSASRIKDISETGICIPLDLNLPVNSLVELGIPFEEFNASIKTLARVVWISPRSDGSGARYDVGFEFAELATHQRNMIRRCIDRAK